MNTQTEMKENSTGSSVHKWALFGASCINIGSLVSSNLCTAYNLFYHTDSIARAFACKDEKWHL